MGQYNNGFTYYPNENTDCLEDNNLLKKAKEDIKSIKEIVRNLLDSNPSNKEVVSEVFELESSNPHYINYIKSELKKSGIDVVPPFDEQPQTGVSTEPFYRNLIRVRCQKEQEMEPDRKEQEMEPDR